MMRLAMPGEPAVFTLEAIDALLPELKARMSAQMERRADIEDRLERLGKLLGATPDSIELEEADAPEVRDLKADLAARVERYQSAWREIEDLGAVLKDPRTGLLDFYGRVDGKLVWLCWKYGEDAVTHYHGLDEGFAGRKPIEAMLRRRHLN